ncbi:MAG: ABC transporter substrate-binding protein [Promethearchaeota archaeon]
MKKIKLVLLLTCVLCFNFHIQRNQDIFNQKESKTSKNSEIILSDIYSGSYFVPGTSESISFDQILKIGLLDDMNHVSGDHAWKGAILAAREINEGGGILINDTRYYIGLVYENTDEANTNLDTSKGIDAAQKMVDIHQPHFVIGGFKIESLEKYLDIIMDNKIPFLCTGNGYDSLNKVASNYSTYKYFFRVMPLNGFAGILEFLKYISYLSLYLNGKYGGLDKVAIIREDKSYSDQWSSYVLHPNLPSFGLSIVYERIFPSNVTIGDFENYWLEIEAVDAQITIFLTDDPSGIPMAQAYKKIKPQCLVISMDTQSEYEDYWDDTEGGCQYIIRISHIHNTSITSLTIPYLNKFFDEYGSEPYYPGTGSYIAVKLLVNATIDAQSFDSDKIVTSLEKINQSNTFLTPCGKFAFTPSHDIQEGWPNAVGFWKQWKYIDGTTELLPAGGITNIYPDSLVTGFLRIPPWGINNLVEDYTHKLPGPFILDIHNNNGEVNLSWTASEGADNYSVYMANKNITYISKKFDLRAYQISSLFLSISGLEKGEYYFAVVAYNETGEKISANIVHILILGRFPIEVILTIVISIIIMIPVGMVVKKRKNSREELISKKYKHVKGKKQEKSKIISYSKSELSAHESEILKKIESELIIEKKQHICVGHGGKIIGSMYLCPKCGTYYCMECATLMRNKGETCRVCKNEIVFQ